MLELTPTDAVVITLLGSEDAVDAAVAVSPEGFGRVAPDEAMLVVPVARGSELLGTVTEVVSAADAGALIVDATDGWSIWTLTGSADELDRATARLTALELPAHGFSQGDLARVPTKLFVAPGQVHILVPAMWRAYLRARILGRCATLQIRERADVEPWQVSA